MFSLKLSKYLRKFQPTIFFLRTVRTLRTFTIIEANFTRYGVKNNLRTVENQ